MEERDAPEQVIFGANDPSFCAILSLAIHLEHGFKNGRLGGHGDNRAAMDNNQAEDFDLNLLLFGISKAVATSNLIDIVTDEDFPTTHPGLLGTHSIRKLPATYARRNGCGRDDVDVRGRWKRNKKQVDTYIDVALPYPDAKVAATLCIGGPVKYELRRGCGISDDWVLDNVAIHIARHFPRGVALVLGKALLWGVFDESISSVIEDEIVSRIKRAAARLNSNHPVGTNPIRKIPLIVMGDEGSLVISELSSGDDEEGNNDGAGGDGTNGGVRRTRGVAGHRNETADQVRVLALAVTSLRRQNDELKNEIQLFKQSTNTLLSNMNTSIRRLAMVPVRATPRRRVNHIRVTATAEVAASPVGVVLENAFGGRIGVDNGDDDDDDGDAGGATILRAPVRRNLARVPYESTLSKCPKTLYVLWNEYEFGVGGRKAAKLFNAVERGRVKFNYSLRKHFWDLTTTMIRRGYSHNTAIDKIYSVYTTRISVTKILRKIRTDKRRGGHPELI